MSAESIQPMHVDSFVVHGRHSKMGGLPVQDVADVRVVGKGLTIAGVYDGHGADGQHYALAANTAIMEMRPWNRATIEAGGLAGQATDVLYNLSRDPNLRGKDGGSTATIAFIQGGRVEFVQLGDSRALFYPTSDVTRSLVLTPVHDASNPNEVARVRNRGGDLIDGGYFVDVMGTHGLQISRAVGDPGYDYVSHEAEITEYTVTEPGTLLLATDGLWKVIPEHLEEALTSNRNADPNRMQSERRSRVAKILAELGAVATGDNAGVVAVEFGIAQT